MSQNVELERALGRVEAKIDLFLEAQKDHGKRLSVLESFRHQLLGISAAISVAGTVLLDFIRHRT